MGPSCQTDPRLSQSCREVFQACLPGPSGLLPVFEWCLCENSGCAEQVTLPYPTEQYRTVLFWPHLSPRRHAESQNEGQDFPQPRGWLCHHFSTREFSSCSATGLAELLEVPNETKSIKYRKFEVCTVDISKDLNNVLLIGGKHLVTSIVVLSAEARAPCQWHTYASRTYKVVRPKIIEWQSTPFIRSLTHVSSLNIFTFKKIGGGGEVKSPVTASLSSQWGSLINPTRWGSRTAMAPVCRDALHSELKDSSGASRSVLPAEWSLLTFQTTLTEN